MMKLEITGKTPKYNKPNQFTPFTGTVEFDTCGCCEQHEVVINDGALVCTLPSKAHFSKWAKFNNVEFGEEIE